MTSSVTEPWHGTLGGYTNHACRCDDCREAHAKAQSAARTRRSQEDQSKVPHGTPGGYVNYRCRCDECRAAHAAAARERRNR